MPAIIGSSSRPELVADAPWTTCWYSGRKLIAPNIVKPSRKPTTAVSEKLRLRNNWRDRIGSGARRSTTTNATSVTSASATSPRICADRQAYSLPPHVVISTSAVMPTASSPAPVQSIRCSVRYFGSLSRVASRISATAPSGRLT